MAFSKFFMVFKFFFYLFWLKSFYDIFGFSSIATFSPPPEVCGLLGLAIFAPSPGERSQQTVVSSLSGSISGADGRTEKGDTRPDTHTTKSIDSTMEPLSRVR